MYRRQISLRYPLQININMRCIEINGKWYNADEEVPININMRCIEMITSGDGATGLS